jgi:maltooligosyltrehalose trehalohydrolase
VVFSRNHDQVGNRARGERPEAYLSSAQLRLAAAAVILSPCLPLLFMGEEYGETAPFPYFVDFGDPGLTEAVRRGREQEFAAFAWQGDIPNPAAEETFLCARLHLERSRDGDGRERFLQYRTLLALRKEYRLCCREREEVEVRGFDGQQVLVVSRCGPEGHTLCLFNFSAAPQEITPPVSGRWRVLFAAEGPVPGDRRLDLSPSAPPLLLPPFGVLLLRKE